MEKAEVQPSLFASNQFWNMVPMQQAPATSRSSVRSTADFATFDFWSQPSSVNNSPENAKSGKIGVLEARGGEKAERKESGVVGEKRDPILCFDELLVAYQTEKGPSPYLKKNNEEANEQQSEKANVEKQK